MSTHALVSSFLALSLAQDPRPAVDRPPEAPAAEEFGRPGTSSPAAEEPAQPATDASPEPTAEGPAEAPEAKVETTSEKKAAANVEAPKWKGNGLLVTAGVLGALGLGSNIARIGVVQQACKDVGYDPETDSVTGTNTCQNQGGGLVLLGAGAVGFNLAAIGTAAAGGSLHGAWAAHDTVYRQGRQRASGAQIGVGAGLLAVGVLGYIAVRVGSFADALGARSCGDDYPIDPGASDQANSQFADCFRNRWSGYLAGITATQAAAVAGSGVLAHGVSYSRNVKLYRTVSNHQVRLSPSFTPTWAGLSLSARF